MIKVCAWCGRTQVGDEWRKQDIPAGEQITHGICPDCSDEVKKKYNVKIAKPMVGGDVRRTDDGRVQAQDTHVTSQGTQQGEYKNVQETAIVATETPYYVDEAVTSYKRDGDRGLDWVYFHVMTDGDKAEFDNWLVRTKDPLAYEAMTNERRFKIKVKQLAKAQEGIVKEDFEAVSAGKVLRGLHVGHENDKFDENELAMGIKVEQEHMLNAKDLSQEEKDNVARLIAMDHLVELPRYYTRLKKMEDEAKGEKK
jgi:hypothetical protein